MTGYEYIRNMSIEQIAEKTSKGNLFATALIAADKEDIPDIDFCPADFGWTRPCTEETYSCVKCRREFLENEISV